MTISIQGIKGSFSHIAAQHLFGESSEFLHRDSFAEVFADLDTDRVETILVPIENSTYGSVFQNYDLISKYDFEIFGEIYLKINFHLISFTGNRLENIKTLYSHPVALGQIRSFLEENNQIKSIEYPDTAGAVEMIKSKFGDDLSSRFEYGAVASKLAAEIYEMEVILPDIHENQNNYTRFFALNKRNGKKTVKIKTSDSETYKTSIEFVLGEESGSLFSALEPFAKRDISLVKIESRPIINTHWQFRFYIDVKASLEDAKLNDALQELKSIVSTVRVLGSYRKGEYINT